MGVGPAGVVEIDAVGGAWLGAGAALESCGAVAAPTSAGTAGPCPTAPLPSTSTVKASTMAGQWLLGVVIERLDPLHPRASWGRTIRTEEEKPRQSCFAPQLP